MRRIDVVLLFAAQLAVLTGWYPNFAQADIFQWEYVDPADPSLGKQPSTTLAPDGAGLVPGPGMNAGAKDLSRAYLAGFDLTGADFGRATLTDADLSGANLTDARFDPSSWKSPLTGADFSGATIRRATFWSVTAAGFTAQQLYSTASYQAGDLEGIRIGRNDLSGWDFSGQNLRDAAFHDATLTGAILSGANLTDATLIGTTLAGTDLSGATIRGVSFNKTTDSGFTAEQLYSTASYQAGDLTGVTFSENDLTGWDFSGQNLTNTTFGRYGFPPHFPSAKLTSANLSGATIRGARFWGATDSGFTAEQLYSTASYQAGDLTGVDLSTNDLTGWDFSAQNLTGANFFLSGLSGADLNGATIRGASLFGTTDSGFTARQLYSTASYQVRNLAGVDLSRNDLSGWDFSGQNLTGADLTGADMTGADMSGATIRDANFFNTTDSGFTAEQLYSTASYKAGDLTGVTFSENDLTGWDFSGQDLTNAYFGSFGFPPTFESATLTGADFSNATIRGANFGLTTTDFGFTAEQLYSTASYQAGDLAGVEFWLNHLTGWDFSGQNLAGAHFGRSFLTGADFSRADARGAHVDSADAITDNFIHPDGHIAGLKLSADETLRVRDFNGQTPMPIRVDELMMVEATATLRMEFEDGQWGSTISFAPDVPVSIGGTLMLRIGDDVSWPTLVGTKFQLFDWTGVTPTGSFDSIAFQDGTEWDTGSLYTTGDVVLTSIPEPNGMLLLMTGGSLLLAMRRRLS